MEEARSSNDASAAAEESTVSADPEPKPLPPDPPAVEPVKFLQRINPHYAFLVLLPWLIFVLNPNWMFQGFGHMDPWYYFGMSINFPRYQHLNIWYPGERLPWIIPARLLVALFSPVYGWMLLHLFNCWISTLCVYSLIRRIAGSQAALVTAAMLACHPPFLGANGWSYIEGGSISYLLITFALLGAAAGRRDPRLYLVLAGCCWAATGYTNLFWWLLTPACALFYWAAADRLPIRRYLVLGGCFVLGLAITTLIMQSLFYGLYGFSTRTFYVQQYGMTQWGATLKRGQALSGDDSFEWVRNAGWMVFPMLTFLVSVAALIRHFLGKRLERPALGLVLAYCYTFVTMAYFTWRETQVLRYDYYASILIPVEFLALGVLVFAPPAKMRKAMLWCVLGVALAVILAPLWRIGLYSLVDGKGLTWRYAIGIAAIMAAAMWRRPAIWVASVVGIAIASFGLVSRFTGQWTTVYNGMAGTRRIAEAIEVVDANTPLHELPVFWLNDANENQIPYTAEYRAIMCSYMSHGFSMRKYPAIDPTRKYTPGSHLILLTKEKDVFDSANAKMTLAGMPLRLQKQYQVSGEAVIPGESVDHVGYWLTFTEVLPAPQAPAAPAP